MQSNEVIQSLQNIKGQFETHLLNLREYRAFQSIQNAISEISELTDLVAPLENVKQGVQERLHKFREYRAMLTVDKSIADISEVLGVLSEIVLPAATPRPPEMHTAPAAEAPVPQALPERETPARAASAERPQIASQHDMEAARAAEAPVPPALPERQAPADAAAAESAQIALQHDIVAELRPAAAVGTPTYPTQARETEGAASEAPVPQAPPERQAPVGAAAAEGVQPALQHDFVAELRPAAAVGTPIYPTQVREPEAASAAEGPLPQALPGRQAPAGAASVEGAQAASQDDTAVERHQAAAGGTPIYPTQVVAAAPLAATGEPIKPTPSPGAEEAGEPEPEPLAARVA